MTDLSTQYCSHPRRPNAGIKFFRGQGFWKIIDMYYSSFFEVNTECIHGFLGRFRLRGDGLKNLTIRYEIKQILKSMCFTFVFPPTSSNLKYPGASGCSLKNNVKSSAAYYTQVSVAMKQSRFHLQSYSQPFLAPCSRRQTLCVPAQNDLSTAPCVARIYPLD